MKYMIYHLNRNGDIDSEGYAPNKRKAAAEVEIMEQLFPNGEIHVMNQYGKEQIVERPGKRKVRV